MPQTIDVAGLIELLDQLRLAGYDIGAQQYINAHNLILSLARRGHLPDDLRSLRTWLAPVLCSSPREQENFYRRFDAWAQRYDRPLKIVPKPGPGPGPRPSRSFNRWLLLVPAVLFAMIALVLLLPVIPHTLSGKAVDEDTHQPLAGAQISFNGKNSQTDQGGQFALRYRQKDLPQDLTVAFADHETAVRTIDKQVGSPITVPLKSVVIPSPPFEPSPSPNLSPTVALPAIPDGPAVPIPTLTPAIITRDRDNSWKWIAVGGAVLPLLLFGAWLLWRMRSRQSVLEKLQTTAQPRLERIMVKGATGQLFAGQSFRRTIQELRRHRQRRATELDVPHTVERTVQRGGLFTPQYGSRQTLPEYLVLIDRASFQDQQARLDEEIIRRLIRDNVFVDAYHFQGDPRVCRRQGNEARYVTLQELAARHPDHHLIIFSDAASFLNPVTGEPEKWLEMCAQWSKRALLTPEPPAHWGHREWVLAEMDFMILPGKQEGLEALSQLIDLGAATTNYGDPHARPFPEMVRETPRRWMENNPPRTEVADQLCDELKLFLGSQGYFWLSACAVYPVPYWDLTLYLGFRLFSDRAEIEEWLLSLVRLPWFRYGSMPDWLRLKLIGEMSTRDEQKVRSVLEDLFLSVLKQPADGAVIDIAFREPERVGWRQRMQKRLAKRRFMRYLWEFIKDEEPESPLRDFLFLSFMSGRKPRQLSVTLPDVIRKLIYPQGHPVFGPRPVTLLALVIISSITMAVIAWPRATATHGSSSFYQQMTAKERSEFVRERANLISTALSDSYPQLSDEAVQSIQRFVDYYANRVGNKSETLWQEDLSKVFGRASQIYAPVIIPAFQKQKLSPLLGLYLAMSYTEFLDKPARPDADNVSGIFQLTPQNATRYQIAVNDRSDTAKAADAAARLLADNYVRVGQTPRSRDTKTPDPFAITLAILSYKRGPTQVRTDTQKLLNEPGFDYTFWFFRSHAKQLDETFQKDIDYVPKFFAAAIVGEFPRDFGLDMASLTSYLTINDATLIESKIAALIAKFTGDDRRNASDELVKLYDQHPVEVVNALINAIYSDGPNSYRINLYIVRTLGSIKSGWKGTPDQFATVKSLQSSNDYTDSTFKYWVDKASDNFNVSSFIDCDCQNVQAGLLTTEYRDQCDKAEQALINQFKQTGTVTGKCDSVAKGPNAKPGDRPPTSGPTETTTFALWPRAVALSVSPSSTQVDNRVVFTLSRIPENVQCIFNFGDGTSNHLKCGPVSHLYSTPGVYMPYAVVFDDNHRLQSPVVTVTIIASGLGTVPDVVGKSESDVRNMFNPKMGFQLGSVTYQESNMRPGTVIKQSPAAGTRAQNGTKIDIVVTRFPSSSDQELIKVPNVGGLKYSEAVQLLTESGLNVTSDIGSMGLTAKVVVAGQTPKAGTLVTKGTTIRLTLAF